MVIAAIAFTSGNYIVLLFVLFLMGCQSTLFGPVKYAYLPQQLDTHELIGGNALVEAGTYIAIILGLIVGGATVAVSPDSQALLGGSLVLVAVTGYLASRRVPQTRAVDPGLAINWNAWSETWRIVGYAREKRDVFLSILGISWFWFFGSAMTLQLPAYTLVILNGNESITTALLVSFAIGVGLGSLLCERMSGHRIELGLVPFGSIGLSLFAIDLYLAQPVAAVTSVTSIGEFLGRPGSLRLLADVLFLGAFGGFYSVPLYALIQQRSERKHLSRIIAANNIINAIFMVIASLLSIVVLGAGFSIPELFIVLALLNAVVAVYIYTLLPEFLMRFLAWILVNTIYRVRPRGTENIPDKGPAIVVCNHVSYMDPILLLASIRRPMRFVMYYKIFQLPLLRFLFRQAKAIPIASAKEDEQLMNDAFEKVDAELAAGNIVCIFPEGGITSDGEIQRFRPGIEKVIARRPVPVVPVGQLVQPQQERRHSQGPGTPVCQGTGRHRRARCAWRRYSGKPGNTRAYPARRPALGSVDAVRIAATGCRRCRASPTCFGRHPEPVTPLPDQFITVAEQARRFARIKSQPCQRNGAGTYNRQMNFVTCGSCAANDDTAALRRPGSEDRIEPDEAVRRRARAVYPARCSEIDARPDGVEGNVFHIFREAD
jgi:1-acyl-sn-glycerol-3-phosphate acyltransferase